MASWALPKGLPDYPARNHLAVHTEDHPMEYNSFQGDIPRGEYGAGSVTIWDQGHYDVEKWSDSEVKFVLHGARASGGYVLFQTKDRDWMIHRHGPATTHRPVPTSIAPMLAVQGRLPEGRTEWAYEVKWDGARAIAFAEGGRVSLRSRNGKDITATFPDLVHMAEHLGMSAVILDGEILALGDDGRPSFARLQNRLHVGDPREARRRAAADPVDFVAFDLLYADGRSLMGLPYDERRARLEALAFTGPHFTTTECFRDLSGSDVLRGHHRERAGGRGGQATRLRLPPRPALLGLGEGQDLDHPGGRHRRVDRREGRAGRRPREPPDGRYPRRAASPTPARWGRASATATAGTSWRG